MRQWQLLMEIPLDGALKAGAHAVALYSALSRDVVNLASGGTATAYVHGGHQAVISGLQAVLAK